MGLRSSIALALIALAQPVIAADYEAVTNKRANIRPSMGDAEPLGVIPVGTVLPVEICFSRGAFCAVDWNGTKGFVSGDLLTVTVDGRQMSAHEAEEARWQKLDAAPSLLAVGDTRNIVAWGDNLTAGTGATPNNSYVDVALRLFGGLRDIDKEAVAGQTSTGIAARMNAVPTHVALDGDAIPASGPAAVVKLNVVPLSTLESSEQPGILCKVAGDLVSTQTAEGDGFTYSFRRATNGEAVACPADSTFEFARPAEVRDRVAWLWLGRNGAAPGSDVGRDIAAAVRSIGHERFLVGSVLTSAADSAEAVKGILAFNGVLSRTYGKRFVDVLGQLQAKADGSAEDAGDVAAGLVPRSLRSDNTHLNDKGHAIAAQAFHDATEANGF